MLQSMPAGKVTEHAAERHANGGLELSASRSHVGSRLIIPFNEISFDGFPLRAILAKEAVAAEGRCQLQRCGH